MVFLYWLLLTHYSDQRKMDEPTFSLTKLAQDHLMTGVVGASIFPLIYKVYRILKQDRKTDKFDEEEEKYRNMLRDDAKDMKERMSKLVEEKLELSVEVVRLQTQNGHLLEKIRMLEEQIGKKDD